MNFCMKKVLIIWISGNKMESFSTQDVSRDLPLVFTKLVWYFKNQDIWSFSSQMVRWYFWYHGIPYLLITEKSLFWTFRWWKYGLFWAKKLMERWCLLITDKFLFWTFWRWEIRSLLSQTFVERWHSLGWVFLSFPWYSRIWKKWFFLQCIRYFLGKCLYQLAKK